MPHTIEKFIAASALAFAIAFAGQLPAFASGDEPAAPTTKAACEKAGGKWDATAKTCSGMKQSMLDEKDQQLYNQGHDQAMAGQYQHALATLGAVSNQNDPMVLTMIGYSERKLGHVDEATKLYFKALAVDPNNVDTHEYLGEGYVDSGRVDLAKARARHGAGTLRQHQLRAIRGPALGDRLRPVLNPAPGANDYDPGRATAPGFFVASMRGGDDRTGKSDAGGRRLLVPSPAQFFRWPTHNRKPACLMIGK